MLEDFISANKLTATIFETTRKVQTAEKAAQEMKLEEDSVAKSILFIGSDAGPILVILQGKDRVDFAKLKSLAGVSDVRLAEPEEVFEITGYRIGGVPPISIYGVKTFVDKRITNKDEVICGGGDVDHLMRIKVKEIVDFAEDILVADVRK